MNFPKALLTVLVLTSLTLTACTSKTPEKKGAVMGDTVLVNYVGRFENGTVFDTNVESVARAAGIKKKSFTPLKVTIGQGKVIPGFENALIGMRVGDKKEIVLNPSQAYGEVDKAKIVKVDVTDSVNRTLKLNRNLTLSLEKFKKLGNHSEGDLVKVGEISYNVLSVNESAATIRINVEEGDRIRLPGTLWNSTVVEVENDYYVVRQDPVNGSIIKTPFGPALLTVQEQTLTRKLLLEEGGYLKTRSGVGRVVKVNESKAVIDFNHPLAGKNLVFEIERVG